ncbi:hypothetical protein [Brevundimonas aurantiaca]|uniref:hypothetical protein n=1 Tax=Brevundimonas aurantiaca TaxID=74316 RepID=UPI0017484499|nr:hypothetical protein [Brevundimonas aurantiaca]
MERLLPVIWIIGIGLLLVTLTAYYAGMRVWLGWGFLPAFAIMIVAFMFRDVGGLFLSVVGFIGMWKGWDWPIWQALIIAFPMIAVMIVTMLGGGIVNALTSTRSRAPR